MIQVGVMKATTLVGVAILFLVSTRTAVPVQSFSLVPAAAAAVRHDCRGSSYRSAMTEPDHDHDSDYLSSSSSSSSSNSEDTTPTPPTTTTAGRRSFLWQSTTGTAAAAAAVLSGFFPLTASAGIDVSGLATTGGSAGADKNLIREQLRAYDGSGAGRVQQLKEASAARSKASSVTSPKTNAVSQNTASMSKTPDTVATTANRYDLYGSGARTSSASLLTTKYRDHLTTTTNGAGDGVVTVVKSVPVEFEFPSDWLQLDRALGGIQYVDQRNGDKLYIFRVTLPRMPNSSSSSDADAPLLTLETAPNMFFGQAIFDPRGSFVKGGNDVGEYKVVSSKMLAKATEKVTPRRRLRIKYSTVTGNGYTVERRALVDAYQVGTEVFMLMTSSNAVNFEKKGRERDTVEAIVDSFRIGDM